MKGVLKMSVFRIEKTRDFTVMSNHHLRNKNMSLRAKGLLSLMLSLPEDWDYTLNGLAKISTEGVDAIRTVIRELENLGYLERRRTRNEKGHLKAAEYIIYERPVFKTDKQLPKQPTYDSPISDNPTLDSPTSERTAQLNTNKSNTNKSNTKELNTDFIKYPSIKNRESNNQRWIDRYNLNKETVMENIDYEYLCLHHDKGVIDNIVNVMTEVLTVDRDCYKIEGEVYPSIIVKERFREVDYSRIESFLLNFENYTGKIHNMKQYLITSLFNTPSTSAAQMNNAVAYDIYGYDGGSV